MRTTKLFSMVAAIIAAGFLVLAATTSNGAFAQTSTSGPSTSANAASSIGQSNTQSATCNAGTYNAFSCNQEASNFNKGNAVSAAQAAGDPIPGVPNTISATGSSSISQSNSQTGTCTAGTYNFASCNQHAANFNFGNAVSTAIAQLGGP